MAPFVVLDVVDVKSSPVLTSRTVFADNKMAKNPHKPNVVLLIKCVRYPCCSTSEPIHKSNRIMLATCIEMLELKS